ncbi:protease inhibitor I42 family protein [Paenibacillus jamilae]|uniref:protease inhibitor I42 family protein n=1 Tax=Paenibacillus jamilae TaxID=114136 RepID=UPI003D295DFF
MKITKTIVVAASLAGCLSVGSVGFMSTSFANGANHPGGQSSIKKDVTQNNRSTAKDEKIKEVTVGEAFKISLEENSTTGYAWSYTTDSKEIKLISKSVKEIKAEDKLDGAPTQKNWTFKAGKPGTYTLKFSYARPWEKGASKTVTYTIKVTETASNSKASDFVILKADSVNTVQKGQKFNIALEENASTGYAWSYTTDSKEIKLIAENEKEIKAKDNVDGAPTQKNWTFTAGKPGTYTLKFSYAQPWDTKADPGQTKTYKIVVK